MDSPKTRTCARCKETKGLDGFYPRRGCCRACVSSKHAAKPRYEAPVTGTKIFAGCNIAKPVAEYHKRAASKGGLASKCISCIAPIQAQGYLKNREKRIDQATEYVNNNREAVRVVQRNRYRRRYAAEPDFKLRRLLRSRLSHALEGNFKSGSAVQDLGCTIAEAKTYLESLFLPSGVYSGVERQAMTWENQGNDDPENGIHGWHIDHKIPLERFDLTDREQLLKACHYTNLQPKWGKCNLIKGHKL